MASTSSRAYLATGHAARTSRWAPGLVPVVVLTLSLLATACGRGGAEITRPSTEPIQAPSEQPPEQPTPDTIDASVRSVAARASYGIFDVTDGGCRELRGLNTGTDMPLASTFKLWVLDALAREVAAGRAAWDEVLPVEDQFRSDPSGAVYALSAGTPLSLRRYAELMISISDNTATDHLLGRLGRETVEAAMSAIGVSSAARNVPLLSTADMTRLKFVAPEVGERYLALGSAEERRTFLEQTVASVPFPWQPGGSSVGGVDLGSPRHIDELEWFATPLDMCATMADLAALALQPNLGPVAEILSLSPGVPPDMLAEWTAVRFKGGSEPGVLAAVYWLARPDGRQRVVVLGWSDPERDIPQSAAGEAAWRGVLDLARTLE